MDDQTKRLEDKIDIIVTNVSEIQKHMAVYNSELTRHIEGTIQNRDAIKDLNKEIQPLKTHVDRVDGALRLLGIISIVVGIVFTISRLV